MDDGTFVTEQAQDASLLAAAQGAPAPETGALPEAAPPGASAPLQDYAAFTLPEGLSAADPGVQAAIDEAAPVFREMGLTQEQAQRLVDLHAKHWKGAADGMDDAFDARRRAEGEAWGEEVKRDPALGGVNLTASVNAANLAVDRLGGAPLRDALNDTWAINHPAIFGAFVKMGRLMREDRPPAGSPAAGQNQDDPARKAALVYPNMRTGA